MNTSQWGPLGIRAGYAYLVTTEVKVRCPCCHPDMLSFHTFSKWIPVLLMLGCMQTGAFILFTADKINCKESVFYLSLQNTSKAGASLKALLLNDN